MRVIGTSEFPQFHKGFKALNEKHFPSDVLYPMESIEWFKYSSYFFAGILNDAGDLVSYANVLLISPQEYADFCAGLIPEEKLKGGDLYDSSAYLYLISTIVDKELHTPYLYRSIYKELTQWCAAHHTTITHVFSLPTHGEPVGLMEKQGFTTVGRYHDYPIMEIAREKSLLINSLLPGKAKATHRPF